MTINEFISIQPQEKQDFLAKIHTTIIKEDKNVEATIGTMMRMEMILYNAPGTFKYGLANTKKYISLHALPIYMNASLHAKYQPLLPKANFQKGCINFLDEQEMPLAILRMLIVDCSKIDLLKIREEYLKSKKK